MVILHYYQLATGSQTVVTNKIDELLGNQLNNCCREICYNVWLEDYQIEEEQKRKLEWILKVFNNAEDLNLEKPYLEESDDVQKSILFEVGPRLNQRTPFCTNATAICHNVGLAFVKGIEISWRFKFHGENLKIHESDILDIIQDKMTQCRYTTPLKTLESKIEVQPWFEIDVIHGRSKALEVASDQLGLAFDDWDIKFYSNLFRHELQRNPTSVECFDLAQSNSEHSRHWFFKARMQIDGIDKPHSLFELVTNTIEHSNKNNVVAFRDNGSVIEGFDVDMFAVEKPGFPSPLKQTKQLQHITLTAETHNFPTGVAPFPGAATGTGGRQRDQHAIGRGAHVVAGTVGYCVGNLNLRSKSLPWEDGGTWPKCRNLAEAGKIIIEGSNGASEYGNQFGEPVITGFFRSFGMKLPSGERREWLKPIMFSGGIGSVSDSNVKKIELNKDTTELLVAKIGGPPYRIGVGGGCASSLMHGENDAGRDFNAVQRGDAEMQQKLQRAIRACIEMDKSNPILSIHDQGAGGNGNVLKEIVEPSGAVIYSKAFALGDKSLNSLELWTAEYQESDAILVDKSKMQLLRSICKRERCPLDVVGELNGSGRIVLSEQGLTQSMIYKTTCAETCDSTPAKLPRLSDIDVRHPVDLDLDLVLGKMPQKLYCLISIERMLQAIDTENILFNEALERVLQLPAVASKRFLTNKVDRSVTGLVAQQQCVGPLHTPLADVAVTCLSHFTTKGTATAIGEQPIKMLVDECSGARMAVGESLMNIMFAAVSDIKDVKCSANWMWPAKLPGEGARLRAACESMCAVMKELGIAVDGGKDSLSMAATVGEDIVKAPGALVISAYVPCVDVTLTITPDLKCPIEEQSGWLLYVPMSTSPPHLGGSALGQCFSQLGDKVPDLDDPALFLSAWNTTQHLIVKQLITAGHDVSDGGLVTCLLEMAFAGNRGLEISCAADCSVLEYWFSERLGVVLEVKDKKYVIEAYKSAGVNCIRIEYNGTMLVDGKSTNQLRDTWESTSQALDKLQCEEKCVVAEQEWMMECQSDPSYKITFDHLPLTQTDVKVAILREEGSNGDREMAAAFYTAGFQPWDITMQDLINGEISLDRFRGMVFVGGFSYADVFGSAKGWAACCLFNKAVSDQLNHFKRRKDTFSLGVCNGCQLMALLGWVGKEKSLDDFSLCKQPPVYLAPNASNRFESRFVSVKIESSHSIMMKGMEDSILGVWVAHGEGRFQIQGDALLDSLTRSKCVPLRYVDHDGRATERYPLNPNGSPQGLAGLCSADGRHLAVMPHPERCFKLWQFPWKPASWQHMPQSPWLRMFQNALIWCNKN